MKLISATKLKNNISYILNEIHFKGNVALIERYGKPIAKIVPIRNGETVTSLKKALHDSYGILPDFPDVTRSRKSRKKTIGL